MRTVESETLDLSTKYGRGYLRTFAGLTKQW